MKAIPLPAGFGGAEVGEIHRLPRTVIKAGLRVAGIVAVVREQPWLMSMIQSEGCARVESGGRRGLQKRVGFLGTQQDAGAEKKQHKRQGRFLHANAVTRAMKEESTRAARHYSIWMRAGLFVFALDGDAQRAEKVEVVGREGAALGAFFCASSASSASLAVTSLRPMVASSISSTSKPCCADILHHPGDLLALDDRLMDGLAELLNQFAQAGCHGYLQGGGRRETAQERRGIYIPYFRNGPRATGNCRDCEKQPRTVAATIISK